MLVVLHLNKGVSTDPLLRHEGSAAFTQVVRGGLMLGHDPDDPDGEGGGQRVLAVSSSNLAAIAPSLVYRIDTARVIGDTGEEIVTAKMVHDRRVGRGRPRPAARPLDEEEQTGTDEAEALLPEELADGPRCRRRDQQAGTKLGITDKQLRRARGRLDVESAKAGFRGGWEWSLPKAPPRRRPSVHREEGHLGRLRDQERDCAPPKAPKAPLSEERAPSRSAEWDEATADAEMERLRGKWLA